MRFLAKMRHFNKKRTQNEPKQTQSCHGVAACHGEAQRRRRGRRTNPIYPGAWANYLMSFRFSLGTYHAKAHHRMPNGDMFLFLQSLNKAITIQVYNCFDDYDVQ